MRFVDYTKAVECSHIQQIKEKPTGEKTPIQGLTDGVKANMSGCYKQMVSLTKWKLVPVLKPKHGCPNFSVSRHIRRYFISYRTIMTPFLFTPNTDNSISIHTRSQRLHIRPHQTPTIPSPGSPDAESSIRNFIKIQTISSHGSSHGSPSKPFHHTLTAAFLRHRPRSSPASIFTSLDLHQLLSTLARFGSISNGAKSAPCTASKMPVEIDQKSVESNEIDSPYLSSCYRFIFKAVEKSECCLIASIHLQDRKMQYRGHFGLLDSPDKIKQLWGYYVWRDSVPIPAVGGISVNSGILKVEYDDNKNDKTSYDVK
ncbi:hypothetical protein LXL04_014542 [Taraxacum kok-saghyz]